MQIYNQIRSKIWGARPPARWCCERGNAHTASNDDNGIAIEARESTSSGPPHSRCKHTFSVSSELVPACMEKAHWTRCSVTNKGAEKPAEASETGPNHAFGSHGQRKADITSILYLKMLKLRETVQASVLCRENFKKQSWACSFECIGIQTGCPW